MQWRATVRDRQLTPVDYAFLVTVVSASVLLVVGLLMPAFSNDRLMLPEIDVGERLLGFAIGASSLAAFYFGITLPFFSIEKWVFWDKEYALVEALPRMLAAGEYLMPGAIVVFVIFLPMFRFLSLSAVRLLGRPPHWLVKLAFGLEKWTMWEVYALALIIVAVKLGQFTALELLPGFWLIMAMVPLSLLDGWLFKRRLQFTRAER